MLGVRELPPLRHTIELETPGGRLYRWAQDEPNPANVFSGLRHASTMPGGYDQGDCVLPRKPSVDYGDLERLSTVRIHTVLEQVGEYRLESTPRVSGDQMSVSPGMIGWQAHLEDDKSVVVVYVDCALGGWGDDGTTRKLNLIAGGWNPDGADKGSTPDDAGLPMLKMVMPTPFTKPHVSLWYRSPAPLGRIYVGDVDRRGYSAGNTQLSLTARVSDDDAATNEQDSTESRDAASIDFHPSPRRFAALSWFDSGVGVNAEQPEPWGFYLKNVAVYGNHGLPLTGAEPAGVLGSDVVAHAVSQWAPRLRFTTGDNGTIAASTFVISQLAFMDPTTVGEIIRQATRFALEDWAVWDDLTFYWNARGQRGRNWRARVGPAQLEETGPQLDRLWESIVVAYRDVDGSTRTVGPPGSGADVESAELKDPDPENPANQLGIVRRDLLQMNTSTAAAATEVGRRFLEQTKLLDSSGRARLVGHVEDDHGVLHPYSHVRAGDTVTFVDAHDTQPRRIVKADHSHDDRSSSIDLDAPPDGLQAVLERLDVSLVPLGLT